MTVADLLEDAVEAPEDFEFDPMPFAALWANGERVTGYELGLPGPRGYHWKWDWDRPDAVIMAATIRYAEGQVPVRFAIGPHRLCRGDNIEITLGGNGR